MTFLWIYPGIIPILHSSAVITPGQFGPTKRVLRPCKYLFTLTISTTGICSVIQITMSKSASAASIIESAANGAGTYTTDTLAPVSFLASSTVLYTGTPSTTCPPLPGVTLRQFVSHNQAFVLYGKGQ